MEEQSNTPSWWRCDTHGPGTRTAWGCPECVRELRTSLAAVTRERDENEDVFKVWRRRAEEAERERDEARAEVAKLRVERDTLKAAAKKAEAALADIGDSDHEPTDDLAWCEQRAQEALPVVRFALAATEAP